MASVQDRTKLKRVSYDTWSTREQLCLASSVLTSGDQNWISVSRSLKPFAEKEALRPPDWFSQKSCAVQYSILLENADAPKRKKRESGETTGESIVRRLTQERIAELGQILAFQRDEYQQLKAEVNLLKSGLITEEKLQKMWLMIEQEEREQEQKSRAHSAWLAKRQQKQDIQTLQPVTLAAPRKSLESPNEGLDTSNLTNDEEDKKNRGGRSPLLTSLLKSPSPTTQIQTSTSTAQVNSPTIASLLGSTSKVPNPQISQSISTHLHQFVTTGLANTVQERPSVGAPTLSMLLELPANLQRGSISTLQTTASTSSQQTTPIEVHVQTHPVKPIPSQNEPPAMRIQATPPTPNVATNESRVQIIDHIDDVIRKDIMADVIDKDEINEIIGDIEELIKEEITASPQTSTETVAPTPPVIENLPSPEVKKALTQERAEPRDVDEAVSLSNSPQSEMAIEEIDQSTSSIAEIIGTVAIESVEPKISSLPVTEEVPEVKKTDKVEEDMQIEDRPSMDEEQILEEKKDNLDEEESIPIDNEDGKATEEPEEKSEDVLPTETETETEIEVKSVEPISKSSPESNTEKESEETEPVTTISEAEESCENSVEQKESTEDSKDKTELELDQIELHLAKITGDQNDAGSAEVVSVCSEVTSEVASIEDTEKSQDISMILEDDESSQSNTSKKKDGDDGSIDENVAEVSDSQESFKGDSTSKDTDVKETPTEPFVEIDRTVIEQVTEDNDEESKVENPKDSESSMSPIVPEIDSKEKIEESESTKTAKVPEEPAKPEISPEIDDDKNQEESPESPKPEIQETEIIKCETPESKEDKPEIKEEVDNKESIIECPEEPKKEDNEIKEEKEEEIKTVENDILSVKKDSAESTGSVGDDMGDIDEEESSLSKLSGGRAMKTYSKKQTIAVDSEPENESSGENADYRAWKKAVMLVYNRLATHKYASLFLRPITEDQAPGYHSVIFRPMDLSTIKKNIDSGTIRSTMHFQRDVMLMFQNAIMYNKQDTFVYKMAVSMQEECLQHMQILVQVTGEGQLRRETRTAASSSSETSDTSVKRKRSHITPSPHDTDSPRGKKRRRSEND